MGTGSCAHRELITNIEVGVDEGACGECHQVRRYERKKQKEGKTRMICKVIKLGRIDGKVVVPGANEILELSPEESAELKVATKAPASQASNERPQSSSDKGVSQSDQVKIRWLETYRKKLQTKERELGHKKQSWARKGSRPC